MTWPTHSLFGMNTVWLFVPLIPLFPHSNIGMLCAAAALVSLLPDLDVSESKIKHLKLPGTEIKPFLLPALVFSRTDQHRGLLHSFWELGMADLPALCAMPWIGVLSSLALVLRYKNHLLSDAATKSAEQSPPLSFGKALPCATEASADYQWIFGGRNTANDLRNRDVPNAYEMNGDNRFDLSRYVRFRCRRKLFYNILVAIF